MNTQPRIASLGAVLSVISGVPLCDFDEMWQLFNYLTGDELFNHQMPRAHLHCSPLLLQQHPDLNIDVPETLRGEAEVKAWLAEQEKTLGSHRAVAPVEGWQKRNPLTELVEMRAGKPIVAIVTDESGERRSTQDGAET